MKKTSQYMKDSGTKSSILVLDTQLLPNLDHLISRFLGLRAEWMLLMLMSTLMRFPTAAKNMHG